MSSIIISGRGTICPKARAEIEALGLDTVAHTTDQCECGYGCRPGACDHWRAQQWWVEGDDLGSIETARQERDVRAVLWRHRCGSRACRVAKAEKARR